MKNCQYPLSSPILPPRQQQVLDYVSARVGAGRPFPTPQEIAEHMRWKSATSAFECLCRLEWRGKVERVVLGRSNQLPASQRGANSRVAWKLKEAA